MLVLESSSSPSSLFPSRWPSYSYQETGGSGQTNGMMSRSHAAASALRLRPILTSTSIVLAHVFTTCNITSVFVVSAFQCCCTHDNRARTANGLAFTTTTSRAVRAKRIEYSQVKALEAKSKKDDPFDFGVNEGIATLIIDRTYDYNKHNQKDSEKTRIKDDTYERRRALWEDRYGSVEALRQTFGTPKRPWLGDLDPESTRQLYHTLLPRSLLGLYEAGLMKPDELAPLAYQARKAAKEYARERSMLPGRLAAQAFDGFRSLKRNGRFKADGISWEELWDKYEGQIVEEECRSCIENGDRTCRIDQKALADRIYLRILERSCATNEAWDRLLPNKDKSKQKNQKQHQQNDGNDAEDDDEDDDDEDDDDELPPLDTISKQLEDDVRDILLNPEEAKKAVKFDIKREKKRWKEEKKQQKALAKRLELEEKVGLKLQEKMEKAVEKARKKEEKMEKKRQKALEKALQKASEKDRKRKKRQRGGQTEETDHGDAIVVGDEFDSNKTEDRVKRAYPVLRIMAKTRRWLQNLG